MRIEEVFNYQEPSTEQKVIMEAPYGAIQSMKDKVVGGAKGIVGGGQEEKGQQQTGKKANQLFKELRTYIGQTMGKGQTTIDDDVINTFLASKGYPEIAEMGDYSVKEAGQIVLQAVQAGVREKARMRGDKQRQARGVEQSPKAKPQPKPQSTSTNYDEAISQLGEEGIQKLLQLLQ